MRAMADQAAVAAEASPTLAPSPGSPRHRDINGTKSHPASTRENGSGREGSGTLFPMEGDTKPLSMLLADVPRGPQQRLGPSKSRTAPSSPSVSPSESRAALLRLREARLEDARRRLSEAVQEPLSHLSRLMAEESGPAGRAKGGCSPGRGESEGRGDGGQRVRDWSPWEPTLNCRYEICSYGDVIQVVEVAQHKAEPPEQPPPSALPGGTVPGRALACVALLTYGYLVLPLPPYAAGLCLGLTCGLLLGLLAVLLLLMKPPPLPRLRPELLPDSPQGAHSLQGWLNQLHTYDPELYHPSLTHSVLATLDGATLKLSYPKSNIPRQATFAEEILDVAFVSHRCYDMSGAKVSLCPPGLARKRLWNKKYPICILFPEQTDTEHRSSNEHDTELLGDEETRKPQAPGQDVPGDCRERCLYLFGRTGREKEEWYHHLLRACRGTPSSSHGEARPGRPAHAPMSPGKEPAVQSGASSISGSTEDIPSAIRSKELAGIFQQKIFLDYSTYMAQFVPAETGSSPEQSPPHSVLGSPAATKLSEDTAGCSEGCVAWVNALVGRIFWDFLRERYWAEQVSSKIQKKLSKIKLPYFMNELKLTELDMGTSIPSILSASKPTINDRGLWVDMEVTYSGSLQMTLETKMNLCKLGKEGAAEDSGQVEPCGEGTKPRLILLADSDAESSSAGSSDEEDIVTAEPAGAPGERVLPPGTEGHVSSNSTGRKILRFVDKIAKSKYFQKATENEFIKKKIEEVSNTPLLLMVEVQELAGTLTVNVPPPPTDRVWYSFRVPPQLELKVCPKLGEREVTFVHVTEWIEKKLQHEFQKILVMPNMDDLIIPIMRSGLNPQPLTGELPTDIPARGEKRL
uniref:SMP-LTD domain-containing protein n=1 Tax=Gallus gallus TaxID=9031 RepID=A0A8V0Z1J4_CHICK